MMNAGSRGNQSAISVTNLVTLPRIAEVRWFNRFTMLTKLRRKLHCSLHVIQQLWSKMSMCGLLIVVVVTT